ncbi:MAG: CARDB domain-containing protein [Candidatus Sedimenticola sp. PURPLELP]
MKKITALLLLVLPVSAVSANNLNVTAPHASTEWCASGNPPGRMIVHWTHTGQMHQQVTISLHPANNTQSVVSGFPKVVPNNGTYTHSGTLSPGNYIVRVSGFGGPNLMTPMKDFSPAFPVTDCRWSDLIPRHTSLSPPANSRAIGKTITWKGKIRNGGTKAAVPTVARLEIKGPDAQQTTFHIPQLAPGAEHNIKFNYKVKKHGNYMNVLIADTSNFAAERREDNNRVNSKKYEIKGPDLVACIYNPRSIRIHRKVNIPLEIRNKGNGKSAATRACMSIEKKGKKCFNVPPLNPGAKKKFGRKERWTASGWRNYSAVVDPDNTVRESRENNNSVSARIHKATKYTLQNPPLKCSGQ